MRTHNHAAATARSDGAGREISHSGSPCCGRAKRLGTYACSSRESFGIAALEARAAGLPVVARREVLQDLLWALINCKEFVFNH